MKFLITLKTLKEITSPVFDWICKSSPDEEDSKKEMVDYSYLFVSIPNSCFYIVP